MPKHTNPQEIGERVIQYLKDRTLQSVNGDLTKIVYCDLGGNSLTAQQYCKKLDDDYDFAKCELETILVIPQATKSRTGLTVREQRSIASEVARFYDDKLMKTTALNEFVASRPVIAAAYSKEDLTKVADTLNIEHGIKVAVPTQEFLDDICRKNGLELYKDE